jgi:glycosyltransferase involved in cell wall biosynthesis
MNGLRNLVRTIDIVVPAYNEEAGIARTIRLLFERLRHLPYRFELIVVDDGSTDRTAAIVRRYADLYPVRLVSLTRNFGKETAMLAGLDHARGAATILMDADLQHPVELIPRFLEQWESGYESVYAVKAHRRSEGLLKRLATKIFYLSVNSGAEVPIPADAVDFRLLDRAVVHALCSIRERVRFTKGLYAWLGFRSVGIPFVPAERVAGASRFDAGALLRLGWDGLTSFSDLPLRISGFVGAAVAGVALLYALYIAARTIVLGVDIPGWATLTVAIMFLSGLQILFLGVLGQYVRNVFLETKQRPNYLVREVVGTAEQNLAAPADRVLSVGDGEELEGGRLGAVVPSRVAAA